MRTRIGNVGNVEEFWTLLDLSSGEHHAQNVRCQSGRVVSRYTMR